MLYGLNGLYGLFVLYGFVGLNGLFVLYGFDGLNGFYCCAVRIDGLNGFVAIICFRVIRMIRTDYSFLCASSSTFICAMVRLSRL